MEYLDILAIDIGQLNDEIMRENVDDIVMMELWESDEYEIIRTDLSFFSTVNKFEK